MNGHQAVPLAFSILALTQAACATTAGQGPHPKVAFAVGAAPAVCRVAAPPVVVSGKPYLKPYVPNGVIAVAEEDRLEAVFTARSESGKQCVAVDVGTMEARAPAREAERDACGRLGRIESPVSATSEAETMLAWDATRGDTSSLYVGALTYDIAWPGWPVSRPHARVAAHRFAVPPGGLEGMASQPSLAEIGHERFLLTWRQGTVERSQLRAQPIAGWGDPIGPALDLAPADASPIASSSAAFRANGVGVVTYFASTGDRIDVMATPIDCSPG
jgi:hypothetical protein